jgi:hypothetical protein
MTIISSKTLVLIVAIRFEEAKIPHPGAVPLTRKMPHIERGMREKVDVILCHTCSVQQGAMPYWYCFRQSAFTVEIPISFLWGNAWYDACTCIGGEA